MEYFFIWFIVAIFWACVWGFVVQKVIENKGYKENWFWWGFFFEIFALIVALTKPSVNSTEVVIKNTLPKTRKMLTKGMSTSKVDVNSSIHIASWDIQKENDEDLVLSIEFLNVSEKIASAVMLSVTGFNSFGDKILVSENETFDVIGQDMSIASGEYGNIQTVLLNADIRKVGIEVKKVCFTDGTIEDNGESRWIETDKKPLTNDLLLCVERENENGKYHAIIEKDYWQCVCGFVNTGHSCKLCGMEKAHATKFTEENIDMTYHQYLKDIELEKQQEAERLEKAKIEREIEKKKEKKVCIIGGLVLVGVIVVGLIIGKQLEIAEANLTIKEIVDSNSVWTLEGTHSNPYDKYYFDCEEMKFINVFESSSNSRRFEYDMEIIDDDTIRVEGVRDIEVPAEITIIDKNRLEIKFLESYWYTEGENYLNKEN